MYATKEAKKIHQVHAMRLSLVKGGLVALATVIAFSPSMAFAAHRTPPKFHKANAPVNLLAPTSWVTQGGVHIANDGTITLTEKGSESESAYKDVNVRGRAGDYAVLMAYTKAENVRKDDITGLPNIHAYAMNENGKIIAYWNGQGTMHKNAKSGQWVVSSGIYKIPAGTATIRYFVEQAEKAGSAKYGDDAVFKHPVLYVVNEKADAHRLVTSYHFGLQSLK